MKVGAFSAATDVLGLQAAENFFRFCSEPIDPKLSPQG